MSFYICLLPISSAIILFVILCAVRFSSFSLMRISRLFLCCYCVRVCRHTHTGLVWGCWRQTGRCYQWLYFLLVLLLLLRFFLFQNIKKKTSFFFLFLFFLGFLLRGGHFFLVGPLCIFFFLVCRYHSIYIGSFIL